MAGAARGTGHSEDGQEDALARRFAELHRRIEPFARVHLGPRGALRLHAAALGWDLLRAPANVLLAPLRLAARLLAGALRAAGARRAADWLGARPMLLRTAVARRVEALVLDELLRPVAAGEATLEQRLELWAPAALAEYGAARVAVAEIATLLVVLGTGALAYEALTPGVLSLAPAVAGSLARDAAVASFPLGERLGALWHDVFPAAPAPWLVAAAGAGLALVGSAVATFAGVLADPVQWRLGVHRRRLARLAASFEAELAGAPRAFAAPEPYLARLADLLDAGAALIRLLRP